MYVLKQVNMNKLLIAMIFSLWLPLASAIDPQDMPRTQQLPLSKQTDTQHWPVLRLAAHTFPPFQYKKNDEMVGPGMTIMAAICEEAKIRCEVSMGAFKDQYALVMEGGADVLYTFLLNASPERNAIWIDSPPFLKTWYSFFTTSTSSWQWTGNPKELEGRTIGVYGPSGTAIIAHEVAAKNPTAKVIMEPTNLMAFQQLIIGIYGAHSAVVANRDVGLAFIRSANISGPKWAGDIKLTEYGYGIPRASPKAYLAPRLAAATLALQQRGVIQRMLRENEFPLVPVDP